MKLLESSESEQILGCDKRELPQPRADTTALATLDLELLHDVAEQYIRASKSANTRRAYRSDWDHFIGWCAHHGLAELPAEVSTVALYVSALAAVSKVATITRRLAAISQAHQMAGYEPPTGSSAVRNVMSGIRRANGTAPSTKTPTLTDDIRAMVTALPAGLLGIRDRALLLVGFTGAFRRSELVAIDHADVEITRDGLVVTLHRSKTDQEGAGRKVALPYGSNPETCAVRSLEAWLEASTISEGAIFRHVNRHGRLQPGRLSGYAIALVVKRTAAAAGLDPSKYAGHSLRSGLATSAAIGGASERSIMAQTGHRSVTMVRRYIRDGNLFRDNAASRTGL